jgi:hypothetical protein
VVAVGIKIKLRLLTAVLQVSRRVRTMVVLRSRAVAARVGRRPVVVARRRRRFVLMARRRLTVFVPLSVLLGSIWLAASAVVAVLRRVQAAAL